MNFKTTGVRIYHFLVLSVLFLSCEKDEPYISDIDNSELFISELEIEGKSLVVTMSDTNPATFAASLKSAVIAAGNGGTVLIPEGVYYSNWNITLPSGIRTHIKGAGRDKTRIFLAQQLPPTSGFLILNSNKTRVTDLAIDAQNNMGYGACVINTNGKTDVEIANVGMANASIGTGTPDNGGGKTIAGLRVIGCSFYNCGHGINFNRQYHNGSFKWIKKVVIEWCWFGGEQEAGISIDCGNDGADGPDRVKNLPQALEAQGVVTNMDRMLIANCTFNQAKKYNIAVSKAWNIEIKNNKLFGNTGELEWGEAINIEHEANHIFIEDNEIYNNNPGVKERNFSYISLLTFRDYGNTASLENGVREIFIRRNKFKGDCKYGISGEFATAITINNNDFQDPQPTSKAVNFYTKSSYVWHWSNNIPDSQINIVN